jgi:hypothetical protein
MRPTLKSCEKPSDSASNERSTWIPSLLWGLQVQIEARCQPVSYVADLTKPVCGGQLPTSGLMRLSISSPAAAILVKNNQTRLLVTPHQD